MPPIARTEDEESNFLDDLFSELDSAAPVAKHASPPRKRVAPALPRTPVRAMKTKISPRKTPHGSAIKAKTSELVICSAVPEDLDALMEGVEDWDWDDMNSDFMTPHKSSPRSRYAVSTARSPASTATRCLVKAVKEQYVKSRIEKVLDVKVQPTNELRRIILRDDWCHADVRTGDVVNAVGEWELPPEPSSDSVPTISISSKHNFLIHHPDILLTATSLSNASQCSRKPLLASLVRSSSDVTPSLIWGNMLHEVMQTCLSVARWDERFVDKKIAEVTQRGLGELLRIDMGVDQAITEVKARAKGLKAFADKYIAQTPKPEALLTNTRAGRGESSLLAISQIYDIEEDIWSPTYGLKGKIDASVEAVVTEIDDSSTPFTRVAPKVQTSASPMPFEIKTGRSVAGMEHRAQTMLYTLLMGERYGTEIPSGLLYYTQSEEVVRVPAARNELRALLVARNAMAGHMMSRLRAKGAVSSSEGDAEGVQNVADLESFLPPTIDDNRTCGKCFALDTCMLYRKAVEGVEDTTSDIADIYELKTGHLTLVQAAFFKKWEALISLEEKDIIRFRKELWTMSADERESKGRCFSNMLLDMSYQPPVAMKPTTQKEGKIHQSTYRFVKAHTGGISLLNGHMVAGDAVVVSVEPGLLALARGFILELNPDSVVLGVDHELDEGMIADRLYSRQETFTGNIVFRIDKDELFGGMARIRDNLAQLFYAGTDSRRLEQVVDLVRPRFLGVTAIAETSVALENLNKDQRRAVQTVLRAQDYALILGMPGTGKTTVIAALIKELVHAGKTVLLSSYTHSAVDTILLKLDSADFDILRLGNLDKIHPAVQKYTLAARPLAQNIEQLENQVMTPPVVATTCLSVDQWVRNKAARKGGLEVSLFRRLSDAHPEAVVDLTHQYRMNADIMLLSNKLIYSDRLQCGSDAVAARSLKLPNETFLTSLHARSQCRKLDCWLSKLMDESCKAVFVDTDKVPARDSRVGDLVENQMEARLVYQVTECLVGCGVQEQQIGVISLYRQQLKLLSHLLQDRKGLEFLTADRSQGRDKDCIIISLVRSNSDGLIGELVKDWRRMNVSFTRARSKLIIIGSRKTLQAAPLLKEFFELMESKGWILVLPPNAHLMHELGGATPRKRSAADMASDVFGAKEGEVEMAKRSKNVSATEDSVLRGRPLLRDVVNDHK
ncbi:Dna2-domain-containing protein [Lentinus tigrinus ALCF2SS1-7]|uniref:DNA replication ATP-dependent helicase/nuclease DNA2 n=1 Tax=Lentinus tigrinus ALCF2SS1-6 TaxID=1328759 RepID=A0A5C2SNH3_9APHY|nr:Dna2-domain-containing protein [Lentinus tigrinus ALCF2SS1-6]RPD79413.1 Dna2-domain-containing protein [Lentinus tigrinus ALCF2SS1-7]